MPDIKNTIHGHMMRIDKGISTNSYEDAIEKQYLFLDKTEDFKNPAISEQQYHIIRICIPDGLKKDYLILSTYSSKSPTCSNLPGIITSIPAEMIDKMRTAVQTKYNKK